MYYYTNVIAIYIFVCIRSLYLVHIIYVVHMYAILYCIIAIEQNGEGVYNIILHVLAT